MKINLVTVFRGFPKEICKLAKDPGVYRPFIAFIAAGYTMRYFDDKRHEKDLIRYEKVVEKQDARIRALSEEVEIANKRNDHMVRLISAESGKEEIGGDNQ